MSGTCDTQRHRISDYERAVCYYTLPRTTSPVTLALILVYALCVLEALAALIYGLYAENRTWTVAGTVSLAGIVILGVVAFTARALLNEVRRRRALVDARQAPDPPPDTTDLPDPFADHVLLTRPIEDLEAYDILDRDGGTECEVRAEGDRLRVFDVDGRERLRVHVETAARSFALETMLPRRAGVYAGDTLVGRMRQRFTLGAPTLDIESRGARNRRYALREGGLYDGHRLVGRIYPYRDRLYLDVERRAFNETLLGLLVALSYSKARTTLL